ncbi:MAG TPA: hypothetical protein VGQ55_15075 [Pyrinomonadaceae bacterium]|nr:hypothetical protein [Pyrinomonadaceae bacterium]
MAQKNFKSEISDLKEFEIEELNQDDGKVASMLGALKRVEAPADFDLQLKGRIARGAPATGSALAPWIRFAAIPGALGALALFLMFSGVFTFNSNSVPPVADLSQGKQETIVPQPIPTVETRTTAPSIIEDTEDVADVKETVPVQPVQRTIRKPIDSRPRGGGSVERTLGVPTKVINPPGINPEAVNTNQRPRGFESGGISIQSVLSAFGIDVEQAAEGWKVKAVSANSAGERSGIQTADLVEMVGDQAVKGKVSLPGRVFFDSITLVRSGKRIVIKLAGR